MFHKYEGFRTQSKIRKIPTIIKLFFSFINYQMMFPSTAASVMVDLITWQCKQLYYGVTLEFTSRCPRVKWWKYIRAAWLLQEASNYWGSPCLSRTKYLKKYFLSSVTLNEAALRLSESSATTYLISISFQFCSFRSISAGKKYQCSLVFSAQSLCALRYIIMNGCCSDSRSFLLRIKNIQGAMFLKTTTF